VIYPLRLRFAYRDQILQTLRDSYQDRPSGKLRFWIHAYADLVRSSLTERFAMARDLVFQRPLAFHTLLLAGILTLLGGGAAFTIDQMMRSGANQPQIDMCDWYAGELTAGESPADVIPPGYVDLERSLQPFVVFYDDHGQPVAGTGYLDQKLPTPPAGVFDYVRSNGLEKVTWQPQRGVRLASVVRRVNGKNPGFLLAARSLRLVEEQKSTLWWMALGIWVAVMILLLGGASLLHRA
jgi:hypothetical protein